MKGYFLRIGENNFMLVVTNLLTKYPYNYIILGVSKN